MDESVPRIDVEAPGFAQTAEKALLIDLAIDHKTVAGALPGHMLTQMVTDSGVTRDIGADFRKDVIPPPSHTATQVVAQQAM